ncbi:MAG TPA: hypothetical protein VFX59_18930 [Polyangiales bacterium]|nr:hypothetical protein [Polyangiales bacterium]
MAISDEHHLLKADLEGAARELGVTIERKQSTADGGKRVREVELTLPRATAVSARFVREDLIRRAEKLFVDEVEVGSAWFDDLIFVITSTRAETAAFLADKRVQQALILLVDDDRHVQIEKDKLRLIDEDTNDDGRDAQAELLALAKHLLTPSP